jgi:lipopolysaccharide/colanic/teichoic acid biosynthesis glycosyltransferase
MASSVQWMTEASFQPSVHHSRRRAARLRREILVLRLRLQEAMPAVRRCVDLAAGGLALLLVSPLLLLFAVAVKLTSRGPIIFRQERIGQYGHPFHMYKLRTMCVDAEVRKAGLTADTAGDLRFKMRRDPRITPIGRILRKYSIDELPQLWNVVRGDMTLVGPRPALRSEVERYDARALRRLELRPGLTCLWQVGGRADLPFPKQVELDIEYIDRPAPSDPHAPLRRGLLADLWALAADHLSVLLKTIPAVVLGRGAY